MKKSIVTLATFYIFISIILGAIVAHFIEKVVIDSDLLITFDKGVKYLMYSGLGLLILSLNDSKFNFSLKPVYILVIIGSLLFSINIFLYTFHESFPMLKSFVHIVPIGGFAMIIGWGVLIVKLLGAQK